MITFKQFVEFGKDTSNIGSTFLQIETDSEHKEVTYKYTYTGYGMYTKILCDPEVLNNEIAKKEEELQELKETSVEVAQFLAE